MKQFHKLFLLTQAAVVICMLTVSLMQPVQAADEEVKGEHHHYEHCKDTKKHVKVHLDYYYELLAEKFVPAQVEEWQTIRKERDLLHKKLKEAKKRGDLKMHHEKDEAWLKKHQDLQLVFKDAVEKRDEKKIKELLPQLFEQYRQMNEMLKKRLEEVK